LDYQLAGILPKLNTELTARFETMNANNKRILIIDDDPQISLIVAEFLNRSGYSVRHGTNGEQGLQICESFKPHLVLCDLEMPIMDGWTMISRLRENDRYADMPVIFLSACRERSKIRQSMNLGGDDFLSKPMDLSEIVQAIEARLHRQHKDHQRTARKMRAVVEIFSGIIDDVGGPEGAHLPWQAEVESSIRSRELAFNNNPSISGTSLAAQTNQHIVAKINNRQHLVKLTEIKALTADGEYSQAHWGNNQKMLFRKSLKQWIKELPPAIFVRIHRQSIINLNFLGFIEKNCEGTSRVHLKDFAIPLPISQRCSPAFNNLLKQKGGIAKF
jgi:hypothetical protein